jgi:hypothetical protein
MKVRGLGIFASIAIITGCWYLYHFSYRKALTESTLHLQCDTQLHEHVCHTIALWCTQHQSHINSPQWISGLRETFPVIDHITSKKTADKLLVTLKSKPIKARVNDNLVITHDGSLFSPTLFNADALNIPTIRIPQSTEQDPLFVPFVVQLPQNILQHYNINWHTPHDIRLQHGNSYPITIRHDFVPTLELLTHAEKLCAQQPKKYNTRCIIDMRFNDQIVIYDTKGEVRDG